MLTAEIVGKYIAPRIKLNYDTDKERVFEVITLVQQHIWKSGKFYDSLKWFYVKVRPDNTIITPHGYNVLQGVNVNFKPVDLHSQYYIFHKNGQGELPAIGGNFNTAVIHLEDSPVIFQPGNRFCDPCDPCDSQGELCYQLTVYGKGAAKIKNAPETVVQGYDKDGNPIYTYYKNSEEQPSCLCSEEAQTSGIDYTVGVTYPIVGNPIRYDNIGFSRISSIIKEPSDVPVEYYLNAPGCTEGRLCARLEPYEISSMYKIYQVTPNCIQKNCILGLFKRSYPAPILHESQPIISNDLETILSMAMGIYMKYDEGNIQGGNAYLSDGVANLGKEVKEQSPNTVDPIQIQSSRSFNKFPKFV